MDTGGGIAGTAPHPTQADARQSHTGIPERKGSTVNASKPTAIGTARLATEVTDLTSQASRQAAGLTGWAEPVTRFVPLRLRDDTVTAREGTRFAFYGRADATTVAAAVKAWEGQLGCAHDLIAPHGGHIVEEYFDSAVTRSVRWNQRPQAGVLLAALADPGRSFDAVVVGDTHQAFSIGQYEQVLQLFTSHQVPLWIPELGGPIQDGDSTHDLVMQILAKADNPQLAPRL